MANKEVEILQFNNEIFDIVDKQARSQLNNIANKKIDDITLSNNVLTLLANSKTIKTITLPSTDGSGSNAREIELQKSTTHIQWRYVGDTDWTNLVALSDLRGQKGEKGDKGDTGDSAISFEGKKILFVGDSFFAGVTGNTKPSTLLDNKIGTVSTNIAVAGASYISDADNCITTTFSNYVNSTGIDDFDIILLSGGGNDCFFNENLAIGTFVDTDTLLSDTTVLGQVQRILNVLKEKSKLNNLIYVLGAYSGSNANGLKNIPLLKEKLLKMLDAYGVQYLSLEGKYGLSDTVNSDGMHPTTEVYNNIILPVFQEHLLYSLVKSNLKLSVISKETDKANTNISTLCQGSLTANGVKIDIVGKKITFTAQEDITSAKLFLITGASLLGGTSTSDFASRLTDSFFDCKSGDTVGLELSNVQSTNSNASGWLALASQAGATQVIVYPQSTTSASATLSATSCGLLCAINNLSAGDTVSYDITVTKNGTEIGNVIKENSTGGSSEDGGWRLINEITLTEDVETIDITKDKNGNPFELTELLFVNCINYSTSAQSIISINYSANLNSINNFLENKNKYIIDKIKLYKDIGLIERESISSAQTQFIYGQSAYTSYRVANTDIESIQSIKFSKYDGTYLTGSTIKLYGK